MAALPSPWGIGWSGAREAGGARGAHSQQVGARSRSRVNESAAGWQRGKAQAWSRLG